METIEQAARHFQWAFMPYILPVRGSLPDDARETVFILTSSLSLDSLLVSIVDSWVLNGDEGR